MAEHPTHQGDLPPVEPPPAEPPRVAAAFGLPPLGTGYSVTGGRAGWYSSYFTGRRSIFASFAVPPGIMSYSFDRTSVAADANGRRFVPMGTSLMSYGSGGIKTGVRSGATDAMGILAEDIDVTDSDTEVGVVVSGALNKTRLYDLGVFGAADATHVVAALPRIHFSPVDY